MNWLTRSCRVKLTWYSLGYCDRVHYCILLSLVLSLLFSLNARVCVCLCVWLYVLVELVCVHADAFSARPV